MYLVGSNICGCIVWVVLVSGIFFITDSIAKDRLTAAINGQISLGVNSESYDQILRYLSQLETIGLVSCSELVVTNRQESPRTIMQSGSECAIKWWDLFSSEKKLIIQTPNERQWKLSFLFRNDVFMLTYFYLIILLGWISIITFNVYRQKLRIEKEASIIKEFEIKDYYFTEARKYAHDIRSPLSAFNSIAFNLKGSHPDQVSLMNLALQKISALTDGFLNTVKNSSGEVLVGNQVATFSSLSRIVADEIELKRPEYKSVEQGSVRITFEALPKNGKNLYKIPSEIGLRRIISNLINNAIESIKETGTVTVRLEESDNTASVFIIDNGSGIPKDVLKKLGRKIFTTKSDGNGIGIYDSVLVLKKIGGDLSISSDFAGTICNLKIPKQKS